MLLSWKLDDKSQMYKLEATRHPNLKKNIDPSTTSNDWLRIRASSFVFFCRLTKMITCKLDLWCDCFTLGPRPRREAVFGAAGIGPLSRVEIFIDMCKA